MTLSLIVFMSGAIIAQDLHNAKVLGIVNLNKKDYATIADLTTNDVYKTALYKKELLVLNEDVQLDFTNDPTLSKGKVIKTGLNKNIFAFKGIQGITQTENSASLNFDGIDDYVETTSPVLDQVADGDFTFEAWINGDETNIGNHPVLFCNRPNSSNGMKFFFHNIWGGASHKMLAVQLNGANYFVLNNGTFNASLLDGTCHHVAVTRTGDLLSFYADGQLFGTRTVYSNHNIATGLNLRIGTDRSNSFPFRGTISDVRIWETARTSTDISLNYNRVLVGNETNLVANWEMNEGEGLSVIDKVTNDKIYIGSGELVDSKDPEWNGEICNNSTKLAIEIANPENPYDEVGRYISKVINYSNSLNKEKSLSFDVENFKNDFVNNPIEKFSEIIVDTNQVDTPLNKKEEKIRNRFHDKTVKSLSQNNLRKMIRISKKLENRVISSNKVTDLGRNALLLEFAYHRQLQSTIYVNGFWVNGEDLDYIPRDSPFDTHINNCMKKILAGMGPIRTILYFVDFEFMIDLIDCALEYLSSHN